MFLFLLIRFAMTLTVSSLVTRKPFSLPHLKKRNEKPWLAVQSVFMGVQSLGYLAAIYLLPVSVAVCIFFLFPVLTYALENLLRRRLPNLVMLFGYVLAMLGTWILVSGDNSDAINLAGVLFGLLAAISQAIVNVAVVRTPSVGNWQFIRISSLFPAIVFLFLYIGTGGGEPAGAWWWSFVAAVAFTVALVLLVKALKTLGSVETSTYIYVEPMLTIGFGVLLHDESLTLAQSVGIAMTLGAIALIESHAKASRRKP